MIEIKSIEELRGLPGLPGPFIKWLEEENPYFEDEDWEVSAGYLIILEEADNPENLQTSVETLRNLANIEVWEWVSYKKEFHFYCACVILSDGFGMVFAIPEKLVKNTPKLLQNLQAPIIPQ
jgi:hypothetical protein